jgi:hypothetical protein
MLEKQIKKSLIETKERKEKQLIEQKIIKSRLSMIVENIKTEEDFHNLSEDKKLKLSFNLLQELSYLQESGLISEQDLSGVLKSIFGGFFGNATQTMFEPMIHKIVKPLFGEGFVSNFIVSYLTSKPSEVIKAFSDCKLMTKLVAESVVEAMVMSMQTEKGYTGAGYSLIRNTLGGALKSSEFIQKIEEGLESTVCGLFGKFTDNAEKVKEKLKTA